MTDVPVQVVDRTRTRPLRVVAWVACIVVLGFVGVALYRQLREVPWSQIHFRPVSIVTATLCLLSVAGVQLATRWALLKAYGQRLRWRQLLPAAWVPPIGKYLVAGGVASVGGAVVLLNSYGVPAAVGLSVSILLDALAVLAGFIVATPLFFWHPLREKLPMAWMACIAITVAGIVLLHPKVFVGMLNWILRRLGRETIQPAPMSGYIVPVLASFGQWLFSGLSLWFMAAGVMDVPLRLIPLFIASSALSITIGYLTPFAPGGIGVREGLYLLTLGPVIGPNVAIVAVTMRVIQTLIELALALVGLGMMRRSRTKIN